MSLSEISGVPHLAKANGPSHLDGQYKLPSTARGRSGNIIDIRRSNIEHSIKDEISEKLQPAAGQDKRLPTLLLYDEAGLKLFEKITYLEQYYLTGAEIEVLETHAMSIAERVSSGSMLLELGSGNLRKVNILLQAFDRLEKDIDYYALDLSLPELQRTLAEVPTASFKHVRCFGLHGTYDDGLEWLQKPEVASQPKCVLSLGSSIGNFSRPEAADFLASFARALRRTDWLLIGLDGCKDPEKVFHAYNDREGVTHDFYRNGLIHANEVLGESAFVLDDWNIFGEYDAEAGRHQAAYSPKREVSINDIKIRAGEIVRVEESYKYSELQRDQLWLRAGLTEVNLWQTKGNAYHIHMLHPSTMAFPPRPDQYAAGPVPSLSDFKELWAVWDTVTRGMIPEDELLEKPIKLRNACIFYLGHIPTFLDIHLTRATGGKPTEPSTYSRIFERGIDPDVDNPDHCHDHSEIPDSWPPLDEILGFQDRVRNRAAELYANKTAETDRKVGRALWISFEHEILHLETLLYMLLQSERALPPPGRPVPDFNALAKEARRKAVENEWFQIPRTELNLGLDDPENDDGPDRYFGWDNEKPSRRVSVPAFKAQARPITNGEFAYYLERSGHAALPSSWLVKPDHPVKDLTNGHVNGHVNGNAKESVDDHGSIEQSSKFLEGKFVRTVFGLVPLVEALDWPVMTSYDELEGYATWANGRIPTAEEVRSIYKYAERVKIRDADEVRPETIAAVNGHLSNEGVEESPPSRGVIKKATGSAASPASHDIFANLEGCNVGFKNWHPVPVVANGDKLSGHGDFGGVWEWTSSVLERHAGFEPMGLYPAYTVDFFDGKHNVVLGGSWATHPRVAGRKTFVNWYQRNYPYVWAGARLVRDL
ncbi:MAG: hypothetical protein M4579_003566 [Chaenotheca gracillima]|nr:MAG: hypothetical protein M4579_003566 [Chaenotheca gracillima]